MLTLSITITTMIVALTMSPVAADIALAASKSTTSGLLNRASS
jgi:hypothetical protein